MFDLSYYYTLQKKEAVMRMMRKFGSVGCKQQRAHLDGIKQKCLTALQSVHCLSYERAFFQNIISHADVQIEITKTRLRKKSTRETLIANPAPEIA